jgi:hypothetical protein
VGIVRIAKIILALIVAASLSACHAVQVNQERASLMPDSVAREIVVRYTSEEWLKSPWFYRFDQGICGTSKNYLPLNSIKSAGFFGIINRQYSLVANTNGGIIPFAGALGDCGKSGLLIIPSINTSVEAEEFTEALIALGVHR